MFDFHRPGHDFLPDGRVVRLDIEHGWFVASRYRLDFSCQEAFYAHEIETCQAEIRSWFSAALRGVVRGPESAGDSGPTNYKTGEVA